MPFPVTWAQICNSRRASMNWQSASPSAADCISRVSAPARICARWFQNSKDLYNSALRGTGGNAPLTDAEVNAMANQLLWFSDPRLVKIVMKGDEPVGFLMAYPDISAALQKTRGRVFPFGWITLLREFKRTDWINLNGMGLIPEYRGSGGTAILYSEIFKSATETGQFNHAEIVQIGMENAKMQREMENFGMDLYKIHRTYTIEL